MDAERSLSEEHLLCPLCREYFNVPVRLKCGHNSCKSCLEQLWDWRGSRECPVCRKESVSRRPPIDLALKLKVDSLLKQRNIENNEDVCIVHKETLKLFCQTEEEPICVVCRTSKKHDKHRCCPIDEAAQDKKGEISVFLESLKKHKKIHDKAKEEWVSIISYIKVQAVENEKIMNKEFNKLHQFLREEQNAMIIKLRLDEEKRTQVMKEKLQVIQKKIQHLSTIISDLESSIRLSDTKFLQEYKQIKNSTKYDVREPECIRSILIDSTEYLGSLKFRTWKKMAELVRYVPVTLDPNTAQSNLSFSDELTSVKYGRKQTLPDNPERCSSRISVLGAVGFTSGHHSWIVDVGRGTNWCIGVARESIKRKSTIFLNPSEGFWVIALCNGDTYWAQTSPRTKLAMKKKPQKIKVDLDYDKGKLVFINALDLNPIYTFKDKFTERVFPFFAPGIYEEETTVCPLTICPEEVSIVLQQS